MKLRPSFKGMYGHALSTNLTVQFETCFKEQDTRIKAPEEQLEIQDSSMGVLQKLKERVDKKMDVLEKLEQHVENKEQYSRRTCLRLYNLDPTQDGSKEDWYSSPESIVNAAYSQETKLFAN